MQIISVSNDARQVFTTVVNQQKIRLNIYYLKDDLAVANTGWFCNLTLLTSVPQIIVTGSRMQSRERLAKGILSSLSGTIIVLPITAPFQDLTSTAPWGITHQLVYFNLDDLQQLENLALENV